MTNLLFLNQKSEINLFLFYELNVKTDAYATKMKPQVYLKKILAKFKVHLQSGLTRQFLNCPVPHIRPTQQRHPASEAALAFDKESKPHFKKNTIKSRA